MDFIFDCWCTEAHLGTTENFVYANLEFGCVTICFKFKFATFKVRDGVTLPFVGAFETRSSFKLGESDLSIFGGEFLVFKISGFWCVVSVLCFTVGIKLM